MKDEVLKLAKEMMEKDPSLTEWISTKFPELRESEDEKIRKLLIEAVIQVLQDQYCSNRGVSKEKVVAWLEKQGEQELIIPKFRIGDYVKNVNDKRESIYEIVYIDKECYICEYRGKENMGDKAVMHFAFDYPYLILVEQKPAWSEEDEEIVEALNDYVKNLDILFSKIKIGDKDILSKEFRGKVQSWLKYLKNRIQPQQEWGEEDNEHLERILKELENQYQRPINSPYLDKIESDYNWLKYLKDKVQLKQEWSEKDKHMLQKVIDFMKHPDLIKATPTLSKSTINWLEFLEEKYTWKPSGEQMDALDIAIRCGIQLGSWEEKALKSLKEQLFKL